MNETSELPELSSPPPQPSVRSAGIIAWGKNNWGLLVSVVVPLVTIATVVIPIVVDANARLTSAETLVISDSLSSESSEDAAEVQSSASIGLAARELIGLGTEEVLPDTYWRVPADAPWDSFPIEESPNWTCTASQIAWLKEWGRHSYADIWNGFLSLSNSATDGSAMSIRNIHSVGTFTEPGTQEVSVSCSGGYGDVSEIIPLTQILGSDAPALLDSEYNGLPAGSPATLNISPGEVVQIAVLFEQDPSRTSDFAGSLVADVVVGDTTTETTLFSGFTRGGIAAIRTVSLTIAGDILYCGNPGGASFEETECSIADFISRIKADPVYRG